MGASRAIQNYGKGLRCLTLTALSHAPKCGHVGDRALRKSQGEDTRTECVSQFEGMAFNDLVI